jgi:hypothetical protein
MNGNAVPSPRAHSTAYGTASMVLGIISSVFFFFPLFGCPLAILALVMSNMQRTRDRQAGEITLRRTKAGRALGIIGIVWTCIAFIWGVIIVFKSAHNMGGHKRKASLSGLTLSSTRTPPTLSSALSQLLASSASFSALAQAGPVSLVR